MTKIAFIKVFLHANQIKTHSVTFDYLIASLENSRIKDSVETKVCYTYEEIKGYNPDIVCVSTATESFMNAKFLISKIKSELKCKIILGGTHITAVPLTLPEETDIGVVGEGEDTIIDIIEYFQNSNFELKNIAGICFWNESEIIVTSPRKPIPMNKLPVPVHSNIKYDFGDATAILTTRGCVNICRHCSEQKIWRPFRVLSPERIVEIMEKHYEVSGKKDFVFLDDISFYNLKRVVEIKNILRSKNLLGVLNICKGAVNSELVTDPIVKNLKELGIQLAGFGLESAAPKVLRNMKADRVQVNDFVNCIMLFDKYGIQTGASTVWGYPGETLDDMKMTRDFLYKWNGTHNFKSFEQYVCQPLPGSDLWDDFLSVGKVSYDMDFSRIRIRPDFRKDDWFYCNEDCVSRDKFAEFFVETEKEIKRIKCGKR